jgi:membrane protein implicated in regulation of membrane protease activity
MSPAFIIFYSLIAYVVNDVRLSTSNHFLTTWAVGAAIVSSVHHTYARFPLPREWSIVISISAFVILTTIAYMFTRRVRDDALHITQDAARRHV